MTDRNLRTATHSTIVEHYAIQGCRACGNNDVESLLDLGELALTGVFPRHADEPDLVAPLEMVKCSPKGCGLVQLRHDVDLSIMYGEHYGYRSSIRPFMIEHLRSKVADALEMRPLRPREFVLDIGSNDGTLLGAYPPGTSLIGCDPSAGKFLDCYPEGAEVVVGFFSADAVRAVIGDQRMAIVTSIAMFYDLPDPVSFMREVREVLADDGIWMVEHSYLPAMLDTNCYDNICHEHLEFYAFSQIEYMAAQAGLKVLSTTQTEVYGGSLCTVLIRDDNRRETYEASMDRVRALEESLALSTMQPYTDFVGRVESHREELQKYLASSRSRGLRTLGYGASTKGNVLLQYCGISTDDLPMIGEVSAEKDGCFTPGTRIPIVSEEAAKAQGPDQLLVLPWIYRNGFVEREHEFLARGGKLVLPLPNLEVVGG